MYPADRVLVAIMPDPADLTIAQQQGWYRIRAGQFERGIDAEYIAFYFPERAFPEELNLGIYYYARYMGHELVRRLDLFPEQTGHKRAKARYYKVQLGPLKRKEPPIHNEGDWRRITFINTTWDRFVAARCLKDLFSKDDQFVKRLAKTLTKAGMPAQRNAAVEHNGHTYQVDLLIACKEGPVMFTREEHIVGSDVLTGYAPHDLERIRKAVAKRGGPLMLDLPL
jgi:hypothetical protein